MYGSTVVEVIYRSYTVAMGLNPFVTHNRQVFFYVGTVYVGGFNFFWALACSVLAGGSLKCSNLFCTLFALCTYCLYKYAYLRSFCI